MSAADDFADAIAANKDPAHPIDDVMKGRLQPWAALSLIREAPRGEQLQMLEDLFALMRDAAEETVRNYGAQLAADLKRDRAEYAA